MRKTQLALAISAMGFISAAHATNGMNLEGYGPISLGMGGASMAFDNGNAAVMNNPATLSLMGQGNRLDVAVGMLGPDVNAKCVAGPCAGAEAGSGGDGYYMPALGWTKKSGQFSYGVALFAQGGMGTEYDGATFMSAGSGLSTRSELGVGRLILPLSYEANSNLTIGGSLDVVWAMMDLKMAMAGSQFADMVAPLGGTQTYGMASGPMVDGLVGAFMGGVLSNVDWTYFNFSDKSDYTGRAKATGLAGKIGFTYKISPQFTVGGVYHSKTNLGDMEGDASLSMQVDTGANGSAMFGPGMDNQSDIPVKVTGKIKIIDFQWPETYGLGMAYQPSDKWLLALDYKRINWADVMKNFKMTFKADNVATNGGFAGASLDATLYQNWDDQNVFIVGMAYKPTDAWTLRAGVNMADNPIPDEYMNPLFPAIEKTHYTLGFGYAFDKSSEVNFALSHAAKVSQTNDQGVKVSHSQTSWQLMYSKLF